MRSPPRQRRWQNRLLVIPIRWRLATVSALLTLLILCIFAVTIGTLMLHRVRSDFNHEASAAAEALREQTITAVTTMNSQFELSKFKPNLTPYSKATNAVIRIVAEDGTVLRETPAGAPNFGPPRGDLKVIDGYRVETRAIPIGFGNIYVQYARPLDGLYRTERRIRLFLFAGVLGGALLALIAGLAIARQAMRPIAALTTSAREIARTRDPKQTVPVPNSRDEIGELAQTFEWMLHELAAARTETEQMLLRQRAFVADASHELRTPLTSILANLELLSDTTNGEDFDCVQAALRSSKRMRGLVSDLLFLARLDSETKTEPKPVDLQAVIRHVLEELDPLLQGHQLEQQLTSSNVLGVESELHRLVSNLVENAIKHTEPGTLIRIRLHKQTSTVKLTVEDSGPGIPPDKLPTIFERFVRGADDRGSNSTGLGLSIVKTVCARHRGKIHADTSPALGGARFTVEIPTL